MVRAGYRTHDAGNSRVVFDHHAGGQRIVGGTNNADPPAAWYAKDSPTFSDTIALVRRSLWSARIFCGSGQQADTVKIPRALFERLTETVCYAV